MQVFDAGTLFRLILNLMFDNPANGDAFNNSHQTSENVPCTDVRSKIVYVKTRPSSSTVLLSAEGTFSQPVEGEEIQIPFHDYTSASY